MPEEMEKELVEITQAELEEQGYRPGRYTELAKIGNPNAGPIDLAKLYDEMDESSMDRGLAALQALLERKERRRRRRKAGEGS
jgi:hypothetical protein